jgi:hypothetical protein
MTSTTSVWPSCLSHAFYTRPIVQRRVVYYPITSQWCFASCHRRVPTLSYLSCCTTSSTSMQASVWNLGTQWETLLPCGHEHPSGCPRYQGLTRKCTAPVPSPMRVWCQKEPTTHVSLLSTLPWVSSQLATCTCRSVDVVLHTLASPCRVRRRHVAPSYLAWPVWSDGYCGYKLSPDQALYPSSPGWAVHVASLVPTLQ